MAGDGYVIVGRVKRAHGIRGEIVVEPMTDEPDAVFASGRRLFVGDRNADMPAQEQDSEPPGQVHIRAVRPFGANVLVFLEEIADRTQAELWNGRYLFLAAHEISEPGEGEVFVHELPGMRVVAASDQHEYGVVSATYDLPQGLMLEITRNSGGTAMLPFRVEMVVSVDRDARVISVEVPEGLFDV